jgi:hypothetical protein
MPLPEDFRQATLGATLQHFFSGEAPPALTTADLRAAVDATDDWIEANKASYNAALPEPARSTLTARQKAYLFLVVAQYLYGLTP